MSYDDLCKSLGIDREAITKASTKSRHTVVSNEPTYFTLRVGPRVKKPLTEDLSHLVSKTARRIAEKLKKK